MGPLVKVRLEHAPDLPDVCRFLIEHSPLPMAALEGGVHIIRYVNPAFCRHVSKKSRELLGVPFRTAIPEANVCIPHLDRVFNTGEAEECSEEQPQTRQNVCHTIWPVPDEHGRPFVVMIQIMVLAERARFRQRVTEELMLSAVRQSEELEKRAAEREAANKELEAFVYSVSHDLRAPLRAISGFSELLDRRYADKLDAEGKKFLDWVGRGAVKMNQIIDDLLNLSRISRHNVKRQDVDLHRVAALVVSELRDANPDRRVDVAIQEPIRASADPGLVKVLLSNLIGNAWKFTSKTENARIEFGSFEKEGKTVYYVKDNGAGFDPGQADRLFQPFHRLHSEQEFEGTGIGLAIVERVIFRHNGKIWAEGKANEGAAFFFTLG